MIKLIILYCFHVEIIIFWIYQVKQSQTHKNILRGFQHPGMLSHAKLLPSVKWKWSSRSGAMDYFLHFSPQHLVHCCTWKLISSWLTVDPVGRGPSFFSVAFYSPASLNIFKSPYCLNEDTGTLFISIHSDTKIKQKTYIFSYIWFRFISSIGV